MKKKAMSREMLSAHWKGRANRNTPIIALLSDFGMRNPYVAQVKGAILAICRSATIIDITHQVAKFNVAQGAYILSAVVPYFPAGTVHVGVVDPGVGTERKGIIVKTKRSYLVGPDNGLLMLAAEQQGLERVFEIKNPSYMMENVSSTFHGRDVFGPVSGHLANGVPVNEFGPEIKEYVRPRFDHSSVRDWKVTGKVIYVDDFGNIVTNITSENIGKSQIRIGSIVNVTVGSRTGRIRFCKTYGDVPAGEDLALIGSTHLLEVSTNMGNAAVKFEAKEGVEVSVARE